VADTGQLTLAGYNHSSLAAIAPYLEPTAAGPSARWAIRTATRLKCTVAVGYPEAAEGEGNFNTAYDAKITVEDGTVAYNSLVIVDASGEVVGHYRKSFLYYTDETWAQEGQGFFAGVVPIGVSGQRMKAVAGICMDINPYKFQAPWTAYEFANHARESRARLVILSMAWLTHLSVEDLTEQTMVPDTNTVGYWAERMRPLMDSSTGANEEVIIICANRCGLEGLAPRIGEVKYAGSSCVFSMKKGQDIRIWDILGRAQEGVLLVDTERPPGFTIAFRDKADTVDSPVEGESGTQDDQATS
jgi:protein N-terminal amidase